MTGMPPDPLPTIKILDMRRYQCPHCKATTTMVRGGTGVVVPNQHRGPENYACLQCIADGLECCSLASLNRWLCDDPN